MSGQFAAIDYAALLEVFHAEAEEALDAMEQALLRLESQPEDEASVATLFRLAHTLKGNAASLRLPRLTELTHVLEDVLDALRTHTLPAVDGLISLLLEATDGLRELVASADEAGPLKPRHQAVLERLRQALLSPGERASADAEAPRAAQTAASPALRTRTLRIDLATLDSLLDVTGEIAVAHGRLRLALLNDAGRAREVHDESERLHAELQRLVIRVRMVPLGPTLSRATRVLRDAAQATGKSARLVLRGEDIEVDTKVAEYIVDPLTHLVRNAVAHGIEAPDARRAAGKPEMGSVVITATREPGCIAIEIEDDGAGLDAERIVEQARTRGLVGPEATSEDAALVQRLIFEPGLTTAASVSELSGRGVGLDVVRKNVEALRGTLRVSTRRGHGTHFTIRLPLTLAIVQGFGVTVSDETFVVPLESVVTCVELGPEQASERELDVLNLRGEALPLLRLRLRLALPGARPEREHVLVVQQDERRVGLVVDRLLGDLQSVIKPLGRLFQGLPGVAGSTILGDGRVALLLDVPALVDEVAAA
jgi:two-component system, chemotaxis family, sensor kinase CheA